MKIRNKILFYFSSTVSVLLGVALLSIFILFSEYREEEFQQRQNTKIKQTLIFLNKYKAYGKELAGVMDELTINDFYDEKMLVFNADKELIFASIDNLPIANYKEILSELDTSNIWIETKVDNYDIVGVYLKIENSGYYAISKAYDEAGHSKIYFLGNVLIGIFIFITVIVILISIVLSNHISKPLTLLSERLSKFDLNHLGGSFLKTDKSSYELELLTERFNALLKKTNEAFLFQKHVVNHISHELKTPISILVSELEILKSNRDLDQVHQLLEGQIQAAKSLGDTINILLEIAKYEAGQEITLQCLRVDELLFDTIAELNSLYPNHSFGINYSSLVTGEEDLQVMGNEMLLKQAFQNLLTNSVSYGITKQTSITFDTIAQTKELAVCISNSGKTISKSEEKYLFDYFFRGANSHGQTGFGLGLVLTKKIILLHKGSIQYSSKKDKHNNFEIKIPLS
ncbi:sensor histidine kinase [Leeuwenhoekiella marinoflava]|uniref:histidine kinase n=2 Tax=Leeuwenhoekiella marinoflava TaxID=988 RepID=A0A4Q0PN61_9FLAO|nr:HAMP domain-containing sensor histidine kinase [Leeuwenhoekiella marinoflava]RXG31979.1 signal transduction histidine kinase [Leeuwenhoekiella marinoflava]SHE93681.1 Signal transduction histidine kinase [Leeuwenhoekiella marinoflava DSM 3653]